MRGSVAYASQESWVLSATLRENILFGLPYHPDWYSTVVEACALEKVNKAYGNVPKGFMDNTLYAEHRATTQWRLDPGGGERGHSQRRTKGQSQLSKVTQKWHNSCYYNYYMVKSSTMIFV